MRKLRRRLLSLLLCLPLTVIAADGDGVKTWFGLGLAGGTGSVQYPDAGNPDGVDAESGLLEMMNFSLVAVGDLAFKLRYTRADVLSESGPGDSPEEAAYLVGVPFAPHRKSSILFVGLGRVFHADDQLNRPINGLAAEFTIFRWGSERGGGEFGLQGFYRDRGDEEVKYIAFNVGLRLGSL